MEAIRIVFIAIAEEFLNFVHWDRIYIQNQSNEEAYNKWYIENSSKNDDNRSNQSLECMRWRVSDDGHRWPL